MIGKRSMLVLANSGLGAVLGYVSLLAMARWMGNELVGARAYAFGIVFLIGLVTRLGFPTTHARRLAQGHDVATNTGTYLALKTVITAAFVALALGAAWFWFDVLQQTATDVSIAALWIGLFIVVARSFRDVAVNSFRGLERILERELVLLANTVVTVGATVAVAAAYAWSHGRWSPLPAASEAAANLLGVVGPVPFDQALTWLMGAYLVGDLFSLGLGWTLFLVGGNRLGKPSASIARQYVAATVPIMVISVSSVVLRRIDEVMLGFWHDRAEVGLYAASARLTAMVLLAGTAVRIVLMPAISRWQAEGDLDAVRGALDRAEHWLSLVVWPVVLFGFTAATPILHIMLSDSFLAANIMFMLLLVQAVLATLTAPLRAKALGLGEQGAAARVAVQAVVLNVALNILLIPDALLGIPLGGLGGEGAALATLASGAWFLIQYRRLANAWTGHPLMARSLGIHAVVAAILWLPLWWLASQMDIARFYHLIGYGLLVLGLWVGCMMLSKQFGRREWDEARAVLRRGSAP